MKAKLLKQIRKRFEIKIIQEKSKIDVYALRDKKTGEYYSTIDFFSFIRNISIKLKRFWEIDGYLDKNERSFSQRKLKTKFNKL
jgi:hypothetical protein